MMQLNLVHSEADEDRYIAKIRADVAQQRPSVHLLHGLKVLTNLVSFGGIHGGQFALIPILLLFPLTTSLRKLYFTLLVWLRRLQQNILCIS